MPNAVAIHQDSTTVFAPSASASPSADTHIAVAEPGSKKSGGIAIDVDEALQGLYLMFKNLFNVIATRSLGSVQADTGQSGLSGFAFSTALSVPIGVCAIFAIRGGVADATEALARDGEIKSRLAASRNLQQETPARPGHEAGPATAALVDLMIHRQHCEDLEFELRRNRTAAGAGLSSSASGTVMLLRASEETALHIGLTVAARSFDVSALLSSSSLAATLSGVSSLAGTLVLGPMAGLLTTALGGFFLHQSRMVYRRLCADRQLLQTRLAAGAPVTGDHKSYADFVGRKLDKRIGFLRRFRNWNAVFLTGSTLFAASALVKAGIGVAALAGIGIGVLSGPVGVLALLTVGTIGAVMLVTGSFPFVFKGGKNKRHQAEFRDDHPEVDRHVLATIDALAQAPGSTDKSPTSPGFALRAKLYAHIVDRKRALNVLLTAAIVHQKSGSHHAGDPAAGADAARRLATVEVARQSSWWRQVKACVSAGRAFLRAIAVGDGFKAALRAGADAYNRRPPVLAVADLQRWMSTLEGAGAQRAFMKATLRAQRDYLQAKLTTMDRVIAGLPGVPDAAAAANARQPIAMARTRDSQALGAMDALLARVEALQEAKNEEVTDVVRHFLALQTGVTVDQIPADTAQRQFAEFCLEQAAPRLAEMAGILLATEMQAARIDNSLPSGRPGH